MINDVRKTAVSQEHRRPRRPPATLRTKDGCLTCLQRKKKCDGQKSTCANCHRVGKICNWRQPSRSSRTADTRRRAEVPAMKHDIAQVCFTDRLNHTALGYSWTEQKLQISSTSIWAPLIPSEWSPQNWEVFQHYVNDYLPQLFRISVNNMHSKAIEKQMLERAFQNQYMMSTLLAQAALHLAAKNKSYRILALGYHVQAISELRQYLDANSVGFDEINVCLSALGLCIFESHFQESHISQNVVSHLDGVAKVIRRRVRECPGYYDLSKSGAEVALQRLILESFLFHASRIPMLQGNYTLPVDLDATISIAAQICESETGRGASLWDQSPVLGVSSRVFLLIYRLSCLSRTSLLDQKNTLPQAELELAVLLLQQLDKPEPQTRQRASDALSTSNEMHPIAEAAYGTNMAEDVERKGIELMILACKCLVKWQQKEDNFTDSEKEKERLVVAQALGSIDLPRSLSSYVHELYRWPMLVLQDLIDKSGMQIDGSY